jgi:single-strand DNA-binding protein
MYQKIIIIGNLGREPEMRYTPGGQAVTNFSVATNRRWNNKEGQPQEETTWFRVAAWGRQAEVCNQYLHQGSKVLIEGRMSPDAKGGPKVFTKQDGTASASYEMTAEVVKFLDSKGNETGQVAYADQSAPAPQQQHRQPAPVGANGNGNW